MASEHPSVTHTSHTCLLPEVGDAPEVGAGARALGRREAEGEELQQRGGEHREWSWGRGYEGFIPMTFISSSKHNREIKNVLCKHLL